LCHALPNRLGSALGHLELRGQTGQVLRVGVHGVGARHTSLKNRVVATLVCASYIYMISEAGAPVHRCVIHVESLCSGPCSGGTLGMQ
jgi:hypothetical protein